jgi:hypothetical protein
MSEGGMKSVFADGIKADKLINTNGNHSFSFPATRVVACVAASPVTQRFSLACRTQVLVLGKVSCFLLALFFDSQHSVT